MFDQLCCSSLAQENPPSTRSTPNKAALAATAPAWSVVLLLASARMQCTAGSCLVATFGLGSVPTVPQEWRKIRKGASTWQLGLPAEGSGPPVPATPTVPPGLHAILLVLYVTKSDILSAELCRSVHLKLPSSKTRIGKSWRSSLRRPRKNLFRNCIFSQPPQRNTTLCSVVLFTCHRVKG